VKFVILTGMSGAGKSTALKMMEDMGYFCVDNLPIALIEKFAELAAMPSSKLQRVAVGIDIRSGQRLEGLQDVLDNLRKKWKRIRDSLYGFYRRSVGKTISAIFPSAARRISS